MHLINPFLTADKSWGIIFPTSFACSLTGSLLGEAEAVQMDLAGQVGTAGMGLAAHPEARRAPDTTVPNWEAPRKLDYTVSTSSPALSVSGKRGFGNG